MSMSLPFPYNENSVEGNIQVIFLFHRPSVSRATCTVYLHFSLVLLIMSLRVIMNIHLSILRSVRRNFSADVFLRVKFSAPYVSRNGMFRHQEVKISQKVLVRRRTF